MDLLKFLSTSEIVAQIISFLLLLFVLKKFFWQKILFALDQRKERITSELKQISDDKEAVARIKAELEDQLARIEDLAQKRIQQAIAEGHTITGEMRSTAQEEARRILEHAQENIRHELSKARGDLRDEIVELSLKVAENVIQEKLTEEQDKNLVRDFLTKIDEI